MKDGIVVILFVIILALLYAGYRAEVDKPAANTETLTCVRVKEVTPAGTINYLCEVRK